MSTAFSTSCSPHWSTPSRVTESVKKGCETHASPQSSTWNRPSRTKICASWRSSCCTVSPIPYGREPVAEVDHLRDRVAEALLGVDLVDDPCVALLGASRGAGRGRRGRAGSPRRRSSRPAAPRSAAARRASRRATAPSGSTFRSIVPASAISIQPSLGVPRQQRGYDVGPTLGEQRDQAGLVGERRGVGLEPHVARVGRHPHHGRPVADVRLLDLTGARQPELPETVGDPPVRPRDPRRVLPASRPCEEGRPARACAAREYCPSRALRAGRRRTPRRRADARSGSPRAGRPGDRPDDVVGLELHDPARRHPVPRPRSRSTTSPVQVRSEDSVRSSGPGPWMPGPEQVRLVTHHERGVAGAHELLGRLGCLAAVQPTAAPGVRRPAPARALRRAPVAPHARTVPPAPDVWVAVGFSA